MTLPLALFGIGDLLRGIWCAVLAIPYAIADVFVFVINGVLGVLGTAAMALLALLPDMPSQPTGVPSDVLHWANWLFPIAGIVALATAYLAMYITARFFMAGVRMLDKLGLLDTGR